MSEESKFDFKDPKSMLSPFEQMTTVMEKVFIHTLFDKEIIIL